MATCEKLAKCPFYQGDMKTDEGLGAIYKQKYCEGDKTICARYMIATTLGPEYVNNHIYPNMRTLAEDMIAKHNQK